MDSAVKVKCHLFVIPIHVVEQYNNPPEYNSGKIQAAKERA